MIKVESVSKEFNGRPVLSSVSFALAEREIVGLIGPSGSGKTVLLKILGRIMPASTGSIRHDSSGDGRQMRIGFSFQEGGLFDSLNVLDNVAFPLLTGDPPAPREQAYQLAFEMLKEVGLQKAVFKMPGQLSGGMRRRVGIARALVSDPELVLLDDPTAGLDPVAAGVIIELALELQRQSRSSLIIVSHDLRRLLPHVSRVLGLFEGEIIADLPIEQVEKQAPKNLLSFIATRYDFLPEAAARPDDAASVQP